MDQSCVWNEAMSLWGAPLYKSWVKSDIPYVVSVQHPSEEPLESQPISSMGTASILPLIEISENHILQKSSFRIDKNNGNILVTKEQTNQSHNSNTVHQLRVCKK